MRTEGKELLLLILGAAFLPRGQGGSKGRKGLKLKAGNFPSKRRGKLKADLESLREYFSISELLITEKSSDHFYFHHLLLYTKPCFM